MLDDAGIGEYGLINGIVILRLRRIPLPPVLWEVEPSAQLPRPAASIEAANNIAAIFFIAHL